MKKRRNTVCKVRLNESELQLFEEKSQSYGGNISAMVRDAAGRLDEKKARGRIEHLSEMLAFYKEYQQRLSWLGGNVYLGRKDNPYGYFIVDHKNKTVHKGSGILSIKELLQFEDARTRFAKIDETINSLLADNPDLTTRDINRILYRQFGTRIHNGGISWDGITVELSHQVREQLRHNYLVSVGRILPRNSVMYGIERKMF